VRLAFDPDGWEDLEWWAVNDRAVFKRILTLVKDTLRSPASGMGHPEPLKYGLAGTWSRRITQEHRLVYMVDHSAGEIIVIAARYHHSD
jgi:toxin YoeB